MAERIIYTCNGQDIADDKVPALFEMIESQTGLDPGFAKQVLLGVGNPIKHPAFRVTARRVKVAEDKETERR
jgi:hypothetical protein